MLGEDLWAETRLLPVRGADGRVESIMGIARDISGRKRIELRLIEHEERFRRIIETTGAGYFRIGVDGRYEDVNQAWLSMHGCTDKSEVVGRHYSEFQAEEDLGRADEVVRSVRTRKAETGEFSRRCKDGSLGFHTYSVNPVLAGHEVVGLEGFLIDTSARRAAQRAQVQSEARHAALFNHMAEGVALHELVFDEAGQPVNYRILDVNPKYEEILGLRRSDVVNRLATEVYGVADPPYLAEYTRMATLGEGGLFETYFAPLGKHFSVAIAQLGPGGFATIFTDITARKQAEAERIKLEEQLQQAQKMESIGRLAGGVAHDFNNLLTVINGYSDMMLAATGADDPLHRQVEQIRIAGERASNLTKQLLAFSRKQIIQPRPLDLNAELGASKAMLPRLLGEDIEIAYDLAEPAEPVMADPGQMQQVLMNLVVNARDAMPCGGKLRLETRNVRLSEEFTAKRPNLEPGAYVLLAVSDTGHGMDEGTLTHIFEPFFTTKGVGKGTGLGLSTVYGIVRQNGGWIEADSVPGQGSRFSIYLPCLKAQESERPKTVPAPGPARGTETILVVEDDEAVRHLSAEVLRGQGYTVLEAADGAAGLALGKDHAGTIHLLLADVVMPGLTGKEMADRLRVVRPEMKILFVSGYMDESVARQGGSEMGSNTLMKPVAPDVLAARVRQILG
jgi:PAS domain S-box-containing protein